MDRILLLLSMMIPGQKGQGLPSGGEIDSLTARLRAGELPEVESAAHRIGEYMADKAGHGLTEMDSAEFATLLKAHRPALEADLRLVGSELLKEYYTDPAVQNAIGVSSRPPFPNGFSMPENNLELLEDVYNRGSIFRDISHEQ